MIKTTRKRGVYSEIEKLPRGSAGEELIEGCMVLEGGAFRAVYEEGVLDYLMEQGINLRCTIGVSAGAINGANYVSGQIGRAARTNLRYRHYTNYIGLGAMAKNNGLVGFDFLFREVEEFDPLDKKRFYDSSRRFLAVATNCKTGEASYFERGKCSDIMKAIQASASLPYISRMVFLEGAPYLDGGCICNIPYQWALEQKYRNIVIIKTREDSYRKAADEDTKHWMPYYFYRKYPCFAELLSKNKQIYNQQCDEVSRLQQEGRVFVISPSRPVTVSRMEPNMEKLGELYFLGYSDAKRQLPALRAYLQRGERTPYS